MKRIYFVIVAVIAIVYVITEVRKGKFSIKESIYWFIASLIMLILAIFPNLLDSLATFLGIGYSPSLLFTICIIFLLFINFRSSRKIAEQEEKIIELAQDIALLKEENRKKNENMYIYRFLPSTFGRSRKIHR